MPNEKLDAPDFRRAEGYVPSSKPLACRRTVIEGMKFTFKDGPNCGSISAKRWRNLKRLVEENEGSREAVCIAQNTYFSTVSPSSIPSFGTKMLLALYTPVHGTDMSQEELAQAGLNCSIVHVDFRWLGMNIWILTESRQMGRVPIFQGE